MILRRLLFASLCALALTAPAHAQVQGSGVGQSGSVTANDGACWSAPGVIKDCGLVPGAGNVTGPASAVSGNLASFSGTTGKIIQDSGISGAAQILRQQLFSSNGTFTTLAGSSTSTVYKFTLQGPGGGGGGTTSNATGSGAGGGAQGDISVYYCTGIAALGTVAVTVPAGGAGGTSAGTNGSPGAAATTIVCGATTVSAGPGGGGGGVSGATIGGGGTPSGTTTNATLGTRGTPGSPGSAVIATLAWGGNGGGPGGGVGNSSGAGTAGVNGGGGAGASTNASAGGTGGTGFAQVEWVQ